MKRLALLAALLLSAPGCGQFAGAQLVCAPPAAAPQPAAALQPQPYAQAYAQPAAAAEVHTRLHLGIDFWHLPIPVLHLSAGTEADVPVTVPATQYVSQPVLPVPPQYVAQPLVQLAPQCVPLPAIQPQLAPRAAPDCAAFDALIQQALQLKAASGCGPK